LPSSGDAPRLTKPPKDVVDLNKQPKYQPQPSQKFYDELPIAYKPDPEKFSGDFFAGNPSPRKPTFKEQIEKLLRSGAIANYNRIVDLIIKTNSLDDLRSVVGDVGMRTLIVDKFRQRPEMATAIMAALLKDSQKWTPPMNNDFVEHFLNSKKHNPGLHRDPLPYTASMNCWEIIIYAAFLCNQITLSGIYNFIDKGYYGTFTVDAMETMGYAKSLEFYPNRGPNGEQTKSPQPGDLVFFTDKWLGVETTGHVAISLGGSKIVSLWDRPNNSNKVQIVDVKDINGKVQIGKPITEVMKTWKF
jgi:hypothetical protein